VRRIDRGGIYPVMGLPGESGWPEDLGAEELADVFRSTLRPEYAESSDVEMGEALENVLDAMSPAEAFNFGSALSQIGKSASRLAADPTFIQVVRTAAPIAGGALGTVIGGPIGTALGSKLGNLAANALPGGAAPPRAPVAPAPAAAPAPGAAAAPPPDTPPPAAAVPAPAAAAMSAPEIPPSAPRPASPVAGGSAAAAQALVLTQQPEVLRSLLATALGQHGRQQVSGLPVAQVVNLFREAVTQAAADADELMYLEQQPEATEGIPEGGPTGSVRSLYGDLLGADNLELAAAAEWEGLG
jgi:hypothetical protein